MREFRDAIRAVRAVPVVSACAILSLSLGIGATTALFSILNGLLLKPLPVREPERLAVLNSAESGEAVSVPYDVWKAARDRHLFQHGFAWSADRVDLAGRGRTDLVETIWASGDIFDVLGVPMQVGRAFGPEDDRPGGGADGAVAVISDRFWRRRFGGSGDAIGGTLTIERVPFRIVGVAPANFFGVEVGRAFDVLLPLETQALLGRRFRSWIQAMARLQPGESEASLTNELTLAQPRIREATMPPFKRAEDRAQHLSERWVAKLARAGVSGFRSRYQSALTALLAAAAGVVLIACANLAMLMLGRMALRRFEFSVRLALGASRLALVRQVLVESLILSIAGAALGFAFALWSGRLLVQQLSTWAYTASLDLSPDWRVFGVAAAAAISTAVLFGAGPAVAAARTDAAAALKRSVSGGAGRFLAGDGLVVLQLAISLILIVASGLFVQSFVALAYRDLGFDRDRVLVAVVDMQSSRVALAQRMPLVERLPAAVASVPGVASAAVSMATPIGPSGIRMMADLRLAESSGAPQFRVLSTPIGPLWFQTYGTRLLAGRDFDDRDRPGAPGVAIVNQAFATRYLAGADPIGRALIETTFEGKRRPVQIVGLVEDAAFTSVRAAIEPMIYKPLSQALTPALLAAIPTISVSLRSKAGPPASLIGPVAATVNSIDPDLSFSFQRLNDQLNYFYIRERLLAMIAGFFGVLGLLLAAVGLYGVAAYGVSRRRREIGIRMALGADGRRVLRLVLGRVVVLGALGAVAGLICSFWLARTVSALLYEIHPRDALTLGAAVVALLAVTCAAGWLPARRAAQLDPAVILREI